MFGSGQCGSQSLQHVQSLPLVRGVNRQVIEEKAADCWGHELRLGRDANHNNWVQPWRDEGGEGYGEGRGKGNRGDEREEGT